MWRTPSRCTGWASLPVSSACSLKCRRRMGRNSPSSRSSGSSTRSLRRRRTLSTRGSFAGYQIQPKKTFATLKGRGWVADYDEGLQKIYFRQGIAATIYARLRTGSPRRTRRARRWNSSPSTTGRPADRRSLRRCLTSSTRRSCATSISWSAWLTSAASIRRPATLQSRCAA